MKKKSPWSIIFYEVSFSLLIITVVKFLINVCAYIQLNFISIIFLLVWPVCIAFNKLFVFKKISQNFIVLIIFMEKINLQSSIV